MISVGLCSNPALRERLRLAAKKFWPKPPRHLLARQKQLERQSEADLIAFVRANQHYPGSWDTPTGQKDLHDLATGRLAGFRETVVPWLDSVCSLSGLRVLEVGCGTGASTVAWPNKVRS